MIITSGRFAAQPQYNALINPEWLARGLVIACNPAVGAYNQVTGQNVTNSGAMAVTPTNTGKSWQGAASKYIDFGSGFAPGANGLTVIQVVNPGANTGFSFSNRNASPAAGYEVLIGNGGTQGIARFRMHSPEVTTADITGLNDNRDHVIAARFIPSTEIKIWADHLGKSAANTAGIPASTTSSQNLRLHNRATSYFSGKSGLFLCFDSALSNFDVGTLLQNPYVIYEAPPAKIWVEVSAGGGSTGTVDYTNANDTSSAAGTTTVTGSLATTNVSDTSAASGTTTVVGSSAVTNANDTSAASGTTTVTGSLAATNANDTSTASGAVGSSVSGSVAYTNLPDTSSASGTSTATGSVSVTNANDTSTASGTTTVTGASAVTNANDTSSASGVAGSVTGTVAYTNNNDTSSASGTSGTAAEVEDFGGDDAPVVIRKRKKKTLREQPNKHLEHILNKAVDEFQGKVSPRTKPNKIRELGSKEADSSPGLPNGLKPASALGLSDKTDDLPNTLVEAEKDAEKVAQLLAEYQRQVAEQDDEDLIMLIAEFF